jgi:proteasome lid subunit RPN8/RPN11
MLILNKIQLDEIIRQCIKELPNEACGILAGKSGEVQKVYAMTNADKSPETYFMDAKEQLKVMKQIRQESLEMVGIYHSHVASQAYPSARDVELAFYPEVSYVILSLRDKGRPECKAFRILGNKISDEDLVIRC